MKPIISTFRGEVVHVNVSGIGPNSAQLEFTLKPMDGGQPETFVVLSDTEPQVFAAMTSILLTAYRLEQEVSVVVPPHSPRRTPRISEVQIPA